MKRILLLFILINFCLVAAHSQSFSLSDANGPIEHNGVVEILSAPDTEIIYAYIFLTNNSSETKQLKARKEEISVLPGTGNSFCWAGYCYPPFVFEAEDLLNLEPGAISGGDDFYGEYSPYNLMGTTIIRYTFFDNINPNDSVSVNVHYITGFVGVSNLPGSQGFSISDPYPNPASNRIAFDVKMPQQTGNAEIIIRNLLGSEVIRQAVNETNGRVTIPVEDLREGFYFYTLTIGGSNTIQTGRFIISR